MKLVRQVLLILSFVLIGEFLYKIIGVPIPGNILGMVLLLIALLTGVVKLEKIEAISQFLLAHLAIFFIPASVGILAVIGLIRESWQTLLFISIVSTFVFMVSTAYAVQFFRRWVK
jgi:holin-like protein